MSVQSQGRRGAKASEAQASAEVGKEAGWQGYKQGREHPHYLFPNLSWPRLGGWIGGKSGRKRQDEAQAGAGMLGAQGAGWDAREGQGCEDNPGVLAQWKKPFLTIYEE